MTCLCRFDRGRGGGGGGVRQKLQAEKHDDWVTTQKENPQDAYSASLVEMSRLW